MGATAKISPDFKIEVPRELRGQEGWKPGQVVTLVPNDAQPLSGPVANFDSLRGIAKSANPNDYRDRDDSD